MSIFFVFILGFLSGSIGLLGLMFALGEYEPSVTKKLSNDLIYKETALGNAIADYRGKRVEICRTMPWMPVLERRICQKEYYDVQLYLDELTINYIPDKKVIYLSAPLNSDNTDSTENWSDAIYLSK